MPPRHQVPRRPVESERSAIPLSSDWIKKLQHENIIVPDTRSVIKFVKAFPEIIQVVEEGISLIRYYFQDADRLVLEIFDEGSGVSSPDEQTLLLVIELKLSACDALERLELLDEVWWHKLSPLTKMRVAAHVTLR